MHSLGSSFNTLHPFGVIVVEAVSGREEQIRERARSPSPPPLFPLVLLSLRLADEINTIPKVHHTKEKKSHLLRGVLKLCLKTTKCYLQQLWV